MKSIIAYFDKPILKVAVVFGLITGGAAFLFFIALYFIGVEPLANVRSFDIGIYAILIFSACLYYRKKHGNGYLHLWEALTIGYVVTCIAAIINGWLIYLFVTLVDPAVFGDYIANALQLLTDDRKSKLKFLSDGEFLKLYNEVKSNNPSILIKNEIVQKLILAIIPILVISLILRKQDYSVFQNKP
jgi:hypothetical protein